MKSNRYQSKSMLCPCYKYQDAQIVFCLGIEEGNALHNAFNTPAHREDYQSRYCKVNYRHCPIYLAHMILNGEVKIIDFE